MAENSGIPIKHPEKVMSDFELGIINAVKAHFGDDVVSLLRVFDAFYDGIPDEFVQIADYFETTYVRGIRARGRRRAVRPRYEPKLWNMHAAVLQGKSRTNNASEGWHNRFQTLVGKSHPSFYSFLKELQKEQVSVEYVLRELSLGKKVKQVSSGRI